MALSKLKRYPEAYQKILLMLPAEGTPITLNLPDHGTAIRERLNFYNFLKFLRRNPEAGAHFGDRPDRVMVLVTDNQITFQLRTTATYASLDKALEEVAKDLNMAVPRTVVANDIAEFTLPPELDSLLNSGERPLEATDPFKLLEDSIKDEVRKGEKK